MPAGSRSTLLIWVVAGALTVLAAMRLAGGGETGPPPVAIDRPGAGAPAGAAAPRARPAAAELYVHVAGAVHRPGLMRVPQGARVAMALERAGGPLRRADLTLVNLAARLQDGQQIVVPERGGQAAARGGTAPGTAPAAPVHLSTATVEQLDAIDGIGPTLAGRIIEFRDERGGFRSLDELSQVDGIGEKRLATLREALRP